MSKKIESLMVAALVGAVIAFTFGFGAGYVGGVSRHKDGLYPRIEVYNTIREGSLDQPKNRLFFVRAKNTRGIYYIDDIGEIGFVGSIRMGGEFTPAE